MDVRMRVNSSWVEWVPQESMNVLPASAGASPPPLSVLPWHAPQLCVYAACPAVACCSVNGPLCCARVATDQPAAVTTTARTPSPTPCRLLVTLYLPCTYFSP